MDYFCRMEHSVIVGSDITNQAFHEDFQCFLIDVFLKRDETSTLVILSVVLTWTDRSFFSRNGQSSLCDVQLAHIVPD